MKKLILIPFVLITTSVNKVDNPIALIHVEVVTIPKPNILLSGTDKLKNGKIFHWEQVSGFKVNLETPDSLKCMVDSLPPGIYKFELTGTNDIGTMKDTVEVKVNQPLFVISDRP